MKPRTIEPWVPISARVSESNRDWLNRHSEAAGVSRTAFIDMLFTSIRRAEEGMARPGGVFDAYSDRIDDMLRRVQKMKPEQKQ